MIATDDSEAIDAAGLQAPDLAALAALVIAVDPMAPGGVVLKGPPGPARDAWMALLKSILPHDMPVRRVPLNVADERLLGGLDLAATLRAGRPVAERGILAAADGGLIVLPSAERVDGATAARIAAAMDQKEITVARDGLSFASPASFGVVAFDEGLTDDERVPSALLDRLAFLIDLDHVPLRSLANSADDTEARLQTISRARSQLSLTGISDEMIAALCSAAFACGILSIRVPLLATRVAKVLAAIDGRPNVDEMDAATAAQLVIAPRALTLPDESAQPPEDIAQPPPPDEPSDQSEQLSEEETRQLADQVLDAIKAAIPAGLLAELMAKSGDRLKSRSTGRSGAEQKGKAKGRPVGVHRGELRSGARLNVVETLRAAAPWQTLRRREADMRARHAVGASQQIVRARRVEVRKDDFRLTRFKNFKETTTIFVVDASGSSALNRLAEAKGAVELLLADCYVRRDSVALISFRGKTAEVFLPPTRSLARAKRGLAGLPGGGGTPLAHGLDAAAALADAVRRKGQTATVIVLTDGRANIGRDGSPGRPKAEADGLAAARALAMAGVTSLVIDISPQPAEQSARLADAMWATYLPLPRADAVTLSNAVKATTARDRQSGTGAR